MVTILNTNRVHFNLAAEQYQHKEKIMIARQLETLMDVTRTLLEEERREFTISI